MWKYKLSQMQNKTKPVDKRVCNSLPDIDSETLSSHAVAVADTSLKSEEMRASSNSSEDEIEEYESIRADSRLYNSSPSVVGSQSSETMMTSRSIARTRSVHVRTKYSAEDVSTLQRAFDENPYPEVSVIENLSQELDVPEDRIKVWFQNKRHRSRRKAFMSSIALNTPYLSPFMPFNFGAVPMGMYSNMPGHYMTYPNMSPPSPFQLPHYPSFYPMPCHNIVNRNLSVDDE